MIYLISIARIRPLAVRKHIPASSCYNIHNGFAKNAMMFIYLIRVTHLDETFWWGANLLFLSNSYNTWRRINIHIIRNSWYRSTSFIWEKLRTYFNNDIWGLLTFRSLEQLSFEDKLRQLRLHSLEKRRFWGDHIAVFQD